jgi:hypothetical protein
VTSGSPATPPQGQTTPDTAPATPPAQRPSQRFDPFAEETGN